MSTRSNIAIKVNLEDLNKKLYCKIDNQDTDTYVEASEQNPYLQIYCHFDGYPSWMGKLLVKHTDYNEILNIILHGDTSSLDENSEGNLITNAYAPNEGFESTLPKVFAKPSYDEEYLYVFENGNWTIYDDGIIENLNDYLNTYNY